MPSGPITIRMRDGDCRAHVATPSGDGSGGGPWPAVILYMDAGGMRPAVVGMAERLARSGFLALVPDLFYRFGAYAPLDVAQVFAGDAMATIGPMMATSGNDRAAGDTAAFLAWLDGCADFRGGRIGAVGFCMGGGMAVTAAGAHPDRFGAVASFHGGRLATESPASPHRLAPRIEAELYVAAAENDDSYPPEMAARFEAALAAAGVRYRAETYPARHGWMMPDFPVHDRAQAERGWTEMLALFARTLG